MNLIPCFLAATCPRTIPASVLRSVMAIALYPSAAAWAASSSGWEAPRRKLKLDVACNSAYSMAPSSKKTVYKPLALAFIPVMPRPEQPIPLPFVVFHDIIIAVLAFFHPPFPRDALRPVGFFDRVRFAPVAEKHGRVIRNGSRYLDGLGLSQ